MNRRSSPLLALVAAGCHGAPATTTTEISHHVSRGERSAAPELDLEAGARMWRAIAPTGADYEARLASVADDDELRRSMAVALLRQGDFACNAYTEEYGCSDAYFVLDPLDPAATLDDPCLRRYLALWSLQQLAPEDVDGLGDVLVDLASMPSPEEELPRAAYALAADDGLRLQMLTAATPTVAYEIVDELTSDAARIHAFVDLHLDTALSGVDIAANRDLLRPALLDDEISAWVKLDLLAGFVDDRDPRTSRALAKLATAHECDLAMTAAQMLADRGDPSFLPSRPISKDPDAHLRAMCLLGAGGLTDDPAWAAWGALGYESSTSSDYGYYDDQDNYVEPEAETEQVAAEDAGYDDRLGGGSWTCDGLTCTSDYGYRNVTITFTPSADGSLVVGAIASQEYSDGEGCGC